MFNSIRLTNLRASFNAANIRTIHSTPVVAKTVTEKVADVANTVNKKMGKGLASAIETGEKATQSTKETLGDTAKETKNKAENMTDAAEKKTGEAADGARRAKDNLQKEMSK